jgi:cyclophilin family peptidyl-prolyl cis-trans isomerase
MSSRMLPAVLLGLTIILAGPGIISCGEEETASAPASIPALPSKTEVKTMKWDSPPKMQIDTNKKYTAVMETEKGELVLELFARDVPVTVNNFVFLARQGYYDGTTFHRVIPGFMAQGGDPTGTGRGSPGYTFANEITAHRHDAGALSMANSGGTNTNGSQFFITYVATSWLDGKHTVFGRLVAGMDVLKKLTPRDPDQNPKYPGDKIIRVTITEE